MSDDIDLSNAEEDGERISAALKSQLARARQWLEGERVRYRLVADASTIEPEAGEDGQLHGPAAPVSRRDDDGAEA